MLTPHDHHACIETALQEAERICLDQNIRFTALRKHILTLIWQQHRPIKAYDLLDQLKDFDASAKPPTVYRTLDFLLEHGLIHRINRLNAFIGCAHPKQHETCFFMICTDCHEVTECCTPALKTALLEAASGQDFTPRSISVEIEGQCARCQTKGTA